MYTDPTGLATKTVTEWKNETKKETYVDMETRTRTETGYRTETRTGPDGSSYTVEVPYTETFTYLVPVVKTRTITVKVPVTKTVQTDDDKSRVENETEKNDTYQEPQQWEDTQNFGDGPPLNKTGDTPTPVPVPTPTPRPDINKKTPRPDEDGYISFWEARRWWKKGGGDALNVDINKLNLSKVKLSDFNENGIAYAKLAGKHFAGVDQGLVYGTITLKLTGENTFKAYSDTYNFEAHHGWNRGTIVRNTETFGGWLVHNPITGGTDYEININGTYTIGGR